MKYRQEIDGLRAIAIIPVILFHAGFEFFSGGFVGVDIFFVISGYLITTILISDIEKDKFSLITFYERRARRILPALFVVMLFSLIAAWLLFLPSDMKDFFQSLVAVSAFSSNILFWTESGYFDTATELKPLLHTWSLAVEEQFYLFFPLFLIFTWKFGKKNVVIILTFIAIVSLFLAEWGSQNKPSATFYLLPTRCWELLIGSLAAFYLSSFNSYNFNNSVREIGGFFGLGLITYSILVFDKNTPFPSIYALLPTIGTLLIILFATQKTLIGALIGNKFFVSIGLISYSAYLWHQPIFAFARYNSVDKLGAYTFFFLIFITFILAYLSWKFIESPFRDKNIISRKMIFTFSLVGIILFSIVGFLGHIFSNKYLSYWLGKFPDKERSFYSLLVQPPQHDIYFGAEEKGNKNISECRFNTAELTADIKSKILNCNKKHGNGILILGDSHSTDLFRMVIEKFDNPFIVGITKGGCRPHDSDTSCHYDLTKKFINNNSVFDHLIYEQSGRYLFKNSTNKGGTSNIFEGIGYSEPIENISIDDGKVKKTITYLNELSKNIEVTWLLPRVEHHIDKKIMLKKGCSYRWELRPNLNESFLSLDKIIEKEIFKLKNPNIHLISQNEIMNFDPSQDIANCNAVFWIDGDHLSNMGINRFALRLPEDFLKFNSKKIKVEN